MSRNRSGTYAVYILYKENTSTLEALNILSKILRIPLSHITIAGLKDKYAATSQLVHIKIQRKEPLPGVIIRGNIRAFLIGFTTKPLVRGKLWGNRFTITLAMNYNELDKFLNNYNKLSEQRDLPAYYGYQRFGTRRPITHLFGKYLVKRDWCSLLHTLINMPFTTESKDSIEWRMQMWKTYYSHNNILHTLGLDLENRVYTTLREIKEKNCYNILIHSIDQRLLKLFLSAYQSYLFNLMLSLKIEEKRFHNLKLNDTIIVPGYKLNKCDDHCKYVLELENITSKDFYIRELKMKALSYRRPVKMRVYDLQLRIVEGDQDIIRVLLSFKIRKGMYATIVLRELTRAHPLILT